MPDMTSLERDTQSRNLIVSEIDRNFFVEAGAGSGKTTMLVNRMVAMVEAGKPIEKICAITFTKAAAGEFYDRFQKLLIERSNPDFEWKDSGHAGQLPKPTEETRSRCAEALQNIDLCFMGTIDSFCGMVLSEHPSEAGIPSDAGIISDEDAAAFYKQQYVKFCSGEYGEDLKKLAGAFRALHRNAEEVFVTGESVLMNNRNVNFRYQKPASIDIDSTFATEHEEIVKAVTCLAEHPELAYTGNEPSRTAWGKIDDILKYIRGKWSLNFTNVLYALKTLKDLRVIPEGMDKYEYELAGSFEPGGSSGKWYECSLCKEEGVLSRLLNLQYSVSMEFLCACVKTLETAMLDKGNMTYFDYLYYLREMLREDAAKEGKLIRHIFNRHSFFLIDEFQDTNPMQAEVFFYLSAEHPVEQWNKCVPRPGSLFIVGDPKQSIYRFRSADVASFLNVKGLFAQTGGEILSLSRNFRSTKVLCDHFNRSFTALLPEETPDQSKFEEIPLPEETVGEFQGVYTYEAYTGKLAEVTPDMADPIRITKVIEAIVNRDEYRIRTKEDKEPRKIRYSDIMVITYGKKKLAPIMAHLDEKGIPTKVEGDVPFGSNEALFEVYKIYSAVADPEDAISLYGALTGALIGLTSDEILKYREQSGKVSLKASFDTEECKDETALLVAKEIEGLRGLHDLARWLSPAALFSKILDDFRVYAVLEAENLEVVYYVLELMRNAERSGLVVSLKDGASYLTELIGGASGEERCLNLNDGADAVHMANLHKVKGLEAPVIILAAATAFPRQVDIRIEHKEEGTEGYIFKLMKPDNGEAIRGSFFETDQFGDETKLESAASDAEHQRLIYVAATRARNALIICDSIQAGAKGNVHKSIWKPVMGAGASDLFETLGEVLPNPPADKDYADSAELYDEAAKACILNDRSMEMTTYTVLTPSHVHLASKVADEQEVNVVNMEKQPWAVEAEKEGDGAASGDDPDNKGVHRFPTLLGTMTHRLLEMLVSTGNNLSAEDAVTEIIREYRTPMYERYEKELSKALLSVAEKMRSGGYKQANGLPQDMLGTLLSADEAYCEVPFCYAEEDPATGKIIWNGIMDVVYCKGGKWHIVDYKTNADGNDLDRKYQGQLSAYIKAFKATTGNDADAYTYHIDI